MKDESLDVNPALLAAVDAGRAVVPNRDRLVQYCQMVVKAPDQSEIVGLFLHVLELYVTCVLVDARQGVQAGPVRRDLQ